jgi:VanZ family protein
VQRIADLEKASRSNFSDDAWKQWIPAIVWLGVIAFESTDLLSAEHTGHLLYLWLTYLFGRIDPTSFAFWHHYLRKTGHVVGYAILSYLLFRAWRATLSSVPTGFWEFRWAAVSFLSTAAVASLDEWHQTFIPSRTGSVRDVVLDSAAALAAQVLVYIVLRYKNAEPGRRGFGER